jgi:hypothetical protein
MVSDGDGEGVPGCWVSTYITHNIFMRMGRYYTASIIRNLSNRNYILFRDSICTNWPKTALWGEFSS